MTVKGAVACATIVVVGAWCSHVAAGPLTPPAGAPESTDKPLVEVEPRIVINEANTPGDADSRYRITQSGSYYLVRNEPIAGVRHGIEIAASDVTIDLMGFTLLSSNPLPIGSPPISLDGITLDGDASNITVRNGTIRGFGEDGIDLPADDTRFEDLLLIENEGDGLRAGGGSVMLRCESVANGGFGFFAQNEALVVNCKATSNAGAGFGLGGGYTQVLDSTAQFNGGVGFAVGFNSRVAQSSAIGNTIGFGIGSASMLTDSDASFNSEWGIQATESFVDQGSFIERCMVTGPGILVQGQCVVRDCVVGNTMGDGIRVNGQNSRIEGNHVFEAQTAFNVNTTGNLIIRNSAFDSTTTYSIASGNRYGAIVDLSGSAPAVSGAPAPSVLGTTDPWANFAR
ncbi:MAG: right-handed parallel beta-helix repeat-containing protein [Planctomycetota bacterium]